MSDVAARLATMNVQRRAAYTQTTVRR